MKRVLDLNEVLNPKGKKLGTKPVFLSKKQREKLLKEAVEEVPVVKRLKTVQAHDEVVESPPSLGLKNSKTLAKRFKFSWDASEDTSLNTDSLILLNSRSSQKEDSNLKNSHWSSKSLAEMSDRDWRILKEDFEISNKGGLILNPIRFWDESDIPAQILDELHRLRFDEPTPVQRATIPTALQGRDIIGIAKTGSGKTLLFLVPILLYVLSKPKIDNFNKDQGPYCLIMVPTRELALQIEREFQKFNLGIKSCSIIGGHSFEELIFKLDHGCEVVVATPGRLIDCIERKILVFNQCHYLVMDEADRMIDMGFEAQMLKILDILPLQRRTMMFTATMPSLIEKISMTYLNNPGVVTIGELGNAVDTVVQKVELVKDDPAKMSRLVKILKQNSYKPPILIFVNYKRTGEDIMSKLSKEGFKCVIIHGSKNQEQRELAISKIKSHEADVLIATDVAGRGIDIDNVSLVINYQMSRNIEEYTHRIGRTGRAGKRGTALTFIDDSDDDLILLDLKKMIMNSKMSPISDLLNRRVSNPKSSNILT